MWRKHSRFVAAENHQRRQRLTEGGSNISSVVRQRKRDVLDFTAADSEDHERATAEARAKLRLLKQLTMDLQQELESLDGPPTPGVEQGLDFYQEVSRFEIALIRRALTFTRGHQAKAARLLNLTESTLSAKIKQYQIRRALPACSL
jgi:DNA-binding NtrC family response regulator